VNAGRLRYKRPGQAPPRAFTLHFRTMTRGPAARDPACAVCRSLAGPNLYEDDLWCVRSADPAGVPGWMMIAQRHVAGPAHFDEREAATFGLALRHFERVLAQVTGAGRICTATMAESSPHFHAHVAPLRRAVDGSEVPIDRAEVTRISEAYRRALARAPRSW